MSEPFLLNILAIAQKLLVLENFEYYHWIQQPRKPILGAKAVSLQEKALHMVNLHIFGLRKYKKRFLAIY